MQNYNRALYQYSQKKIQQALERKRITQLNLLRIKYKNIIQERVKDMVYGQIAQEERKIRLAKERKKKKEDEDEEKLKEELRA